MASVTFFQTSSSFPDNIKEISEKLAIQFESTKTSLQDQIERLQATTTKNNDLNLKEIGLILNYGDTSTTLQNSNSTTRMLDWLVKDSEKQASQETPKSNIKFSGP